MIVRMPDRDSASDVLSNHLLVGLDGSGAETVTIELYAVDEATLGLPLAQRRYHRMLFGVNGKGGGGGGDTTAVLANGRLEVLGPTIARGLIYVRVTAETIAADRKLHLASTFL